MSLKTTEYKAWISSTPQKNLGVATGPKISILMATFNTPEAFLQDAVESVLKQTSSKWELCIADDSSTNQSTLKILNSLADSDSRIKIHFKTSNSGISDTLNEALRIATGDFVGVLDHDDALHPLAVELMQKSSQENSEAILIYSDEDKIDRRGNHSTPFFKPDFSPELLLSQMYLNHFTIMNSAKVNQLGGFRSEFDGAQDHDLALRMQLTNENVVHVPKVLYHWRVWEESTARSIDAKPWAQVAAQRVQIAAMQETGIGGSSTPQQVKGLNEVSWNIPNKPTVSIVIPTASRRITHGSKQVRLIDRCLNSLKEADPALDYEIVIVHTGDLEPDQKFIYENSGYRTIAYDRDVFNFSHAVNLGVSISQGEYVLLLNDDTRMLKPDSIRRMAEFAQQKGIGVVGAKLVFPSGNIQHAGILLVDGLPTHPFHNSGNHNYGYYGSLLSPRNYLAVTAAACLVSRRLFDELNGFDEDFAHDYNDVDFCLRAVELGYRNVWTPFALFEHYEGASIVRTTANAEETSLFRAKYGHKYRVDPYYSPNLKQDLRHLYEYK